MRKFRYNNILLYTSHQWCGNIEEYFSQNSEKLLAFLLMPRMQSRDNVLRIYEKGKLVKEKNISLSKNIFLYYFLWYTHYIKAIFTYIPRNERLIVVSGQPYHLFFMTFQKLFRKLTFVYWIADYFPPINPVLRLFEKLKAFYHKNIDYACYLGDGVNNIMNGKIMTTGRKRTIIWGVKPKNIKRNLMETKHTILFVGVVRSTVGLEIAYEFLKANKTYNLKVIGVCDEALYKRQIAMIENYGISKQVYFPNRFFFDDELNKISKECFVGIALYSIDNTSTIYYADPGKVKAYTEMGLPVIMTKTSSIAPYIEKFKAGEVIARDATSLKKALKNIQGNYKLYTDGVAKFNKYFYFEDYYRKGFKFLEKVYDSGNVI